MSSTILDSSDDPQPDAPERPRDAGISAAPRQERRGCTPLDGRRLGPRREGAVPQPGPDRRSDAFFALAEMTRMPMLVTDPGRPDNPVVFANRALLELLRMPEERVLGRNCRFLQGPDTDPRAVAEIRRAVAEQRPVAVELLNYRDDGSTFWNALFMGPLFDRQGRLRYWFASLLDVSARRLAEQSQQQAQKMEAIGRLTAGMAHDFNNLLHVIVGNLELARRLAGDNRALSSALARAEKAAFKGGRLTQQLLSCARRQRLDARPLDLNRLVLELGDAMTRTLGEGIELRLDLKAGLPACRLDAAQLETALLHLLANARDAMPRGGRVTVATATAPADGSGSVGGQGCVVLCVRDEGAGMPPEVRRRATEPFFTTRERGTGLGLAMVHGFAEQSRGRLEIDSEPGRGTAVRMVFPAGEAAQAPPSPGRERDTPATAAAAGPGRARVLLVEDSDEVRELAQAGLAAIGCEVLAAPGADAALELLARHGRVDLLLTDVMMPGGMNGVQLAERVQERFPGLPVLLMSGYMDEVAESGRAGSHPVLTKPFHVGELAGRVRAALGGAAACRNA